MFIRTESFREFIRYYPIVTFIVCLHILLYLFTVLPVFPNSWLFEHLAGVNLYIAEGEIWRLVTPIFLHSGFAHMLFNSFSLVLFGPALEQMIGRKGFLFLYLGAGIAANIATLLFNPLTYTHVGSSGAIFGLFGFYIAIAVYKRNLLSRANSQIILTITAIGLIMTFIQVNINVIAHVFGLISGFIIGGLRFTKGKGFFSPLKNAAFPRFNNGKNNSIRTISPRKLIIWAGIILLALLGFINRF